MNWSIIYFFLFLFSLVVLFVGTKNPQVIFPNKNISRIRYFLGNLFVSFVLLSLSIAINPTFQKGVNSSGSTPTPVPTSQPTKLGESSESSQVSKGEKATITNVVDGDTVKTDKGEVIRLIGMDAPETGSGGECFAAESTAKLEELVLDKEVELEKDISETDRYQRLLRYIWVGDTLANEVLVREGFAKVSTYPPDVKYQAKFVEAERLARQEGKGLWGNVCTVTPKPTYSPTPKPTVKPIVTGTPLIINTPTPIQVQSQTSGGGTYVCNCSKTCPNMSSCAEAQYQLNVCGCTARDADHDGIACDADCQ